MCGYMKVHIRVVLYSFMRRTGDREDSDAECTLLRGGRDQVHRFLMSMQRK